MKSTFLAFAAAMVLAGCSATPEATPVAERPDCRNVDPPTGSHHIRRRNCYAAADSEQPRQVVRDLLDLQQQTTQETIR